MRMREVDSVGSVRRSLIPLVLRGDMRDRCSQGTTIFTMQKFFVVVNDNP